MNLDNFILTKSMLVEDRVGALSSLCLTLLAESFPEGYVIVLDISGMNHKLGFSIVDGKLRNCHIHVTDPIVKLGGDEYVIVVNTILEAYAVMARLQALYQDEGLSAMFETEMFFRSARPMMAMIDSCLDRIMSRKEKRDSSLPSRIRRAWGILCNNGER